MSQKSSNETEMCWSEAIAEKKPHKERIHKRFETLVFCKWQKHAWINRTRKLKQSEDILLQPLRWCCVDCVIHHERDVREEQKYMYVARTSNNKVISSSDLYCCLLPRCEALRTCRSGFPIATIPNSNVWKDNSSR